MSNVAVTADTDPVTVSDDDCMVHQTNRYWVLPLSTLSLTQGKMSGLK